MGKKYITFSFDDGLEQDKKLIQLMKEYGLKGTFNLNAGLFGTEGEIKGLGNFGFQDCPQGVKHRWPFRYVPHNRIPKDEVLQVYEGMEIASHSYEHDFLGKLPEDRMRESIDRDFAALENLTGQRIVGHAYAKGSTSPKVQNYLRKKGVLYARGVYPSSYAFSFPNDEERLDYKPTCAVIDKKVFQMIERFKAADSEEDMLLYLWGHSYEFDFHYSTGTWEHLEKVFQSLSGWEGAIYCSNKDAFLRAR